MKKNADGTYTVQLGKVGISNLTGREYPPEEMQKAIQKLQSRHRKDTLRGEYGMPRIEQTVPDQDNTRRIASIIESNVCCVIDVSTIQIEGEHVVAKIKPAGPMGSQLEKRLEAEQTTFGMRAFAQYNGNKVTLLDIVTFDLINKS